jgi:DNA-binding beta-propeller fold protein YncE
MARGLLGASIAVTAMLLVSACSARAPVEPPTAPTEPIVWPVPPAPARIRWVRAIAGAQDAGIEKSFLGRIAQTLTGKTEERLIRPTGVAERDGVLYVADPGAQAVWIFDVPGRRAVKVDHLGQALLGSPVAVAPTEAGDVFVADSTLKRIFRLDRRGALLRTIQDPDLERPAGLAYEERARLLYVADSVTDRILTYDVEGRRVAAWGKSGMGDGEFNRPTHVALDHSGALLVTDALNFRIQAFDRDGRFLWKLGHHGDGTGDLAAPKGIATDSVGHLYVVDSLFDAVQIFERDGRLLLPFGERGRRAGQMWLPGGIFITREDRIYVADSYNQRVQVFDVLPAGKEVAP